MNKPVGIVVIVILVVVSVGLAYLIFQQNNFSKPKLDLVPPQPTQTQSSPTVDVSDVPADILTTLKFPASGDSPENIKKFFASVNSYAKSVSEVAIVNCTLSPPIIKMQDGQQLKFNNKDIMDHKIIVHSHDNTFSIQTGESITIGTKFSKGAEGVYAVFCDQNTNVAGMITINKPK